MRFYQRFLAVILASGSMTQVFAADLASGIYNLRQKSSDRYLDAYQEYENDFAAVTRENQANKSQEWFIYKDGDDTYRIVQLTRGLVLDSHPTSEESHRVVTRLIEDKDSQRWRINGNPADGYAISQLSSGRYLDAYQTEGEDFAAVTRSFQGNSSQFWEIKPSAASLALLQRFRERAHCNQFTCGEFRNTDYSNKDRGLEYAAAACNAGPYDIELVMRWKPVTGWQDRVRQTIKPNECYLDAPLLRGTEIHQLEIRINNPRKSVYHLMRSFNETRNGLWPSGNF